jgi:virulence-associated protein VapD
VYAVAFDLIVAETEKHHPKGVSQAYSDIAVILNDRGFRMSTGKSVCD